MQTDLMYNLRSEALRHWPSKLLGKRRAHAVADIVFNECLRVDSPSMDAIERNVRLNVGFPWITLALFLANILVQYIMRKRGEK